MNPKTVFCNPSSAFLKQFECIKMDATWLQPFASALYPSPHLRHLLLQCSFRRFLFLPCFVQLIDNLTDKFFNRRSAVFEVTLRNSANINLVNFTVLARSLLVSVPANCWVMPNYCRVLPAYCWVIMNYCWVMLACCWVMPRKWLIRKEQCQSRSLHVTKKTLLTFELFDLGNSFVIWHFFVYCPEKWKYANVISRVLEPELGAAATLLQDRLLPAPDLLSCLSLFFITVFNLSATTKYKVVKWPSKKL